MTLPEAVANIQKENHGLTSPFRELIKKFGAENINVDELIAETTALVPILKSDFAKAGADIYAIAAEPLLGQLFTSNDAHRITGGRLRPTSILLGDKQVVNELDISYQAKDQEKVNQILSRSKTIAFRAWAYKPSEGQKPLKDQPAHTKTRGLMQMLTLTSALATDNITPTEFVEEIVWRLKRKEEDKLVKAAEIARDTIGKDTTEHKAAKATLADFRGKYHIPGITNEAKRNLYIQRSRQSIPVEAFSDFYPTVIELIQSPIETFMDNHPDAAQVPNNIKFGHDQIIPDKEQKGNTASE